MPRNTNPPKIGDPTGFRIPEGWTLVQSAVLEEIVSLIPPDRLIGDHDSLELSKKALRGRMVERVVWEVNQLKKELASQSAIVPQNFDDLRSRHPDFEVLKCLARLPFDDDDRELICHPARWGRRSTGHAYGILKRVFSPKDPSHEPQDETLRAYRKAYRKAIRSTKSKS